MIRDIRDVNTNIIAETWAFFDANRNNPFQSFPMEFPLDSQGLGIRKRIDDFFANHLGIGIGLNPYYDMLAEVQCYPYSDCK
jgi:hypothetical protein